MPSKHSVGISWYSVLSAWRDGEMPVDKFIQFAFDCGADGIEILDAFFYPPGTTRDRLPDANELELLLKAAESALAQTGLLVHAVAVTNDFDFDDEHRLHTEREKIELGIDIARRLGAPIVRVFSGNPKSSDTIDLVRYRTIDAIKALDSSDVVLALENHGNVFADPARLNTILEPVSKHNAGLCFDVGNFLLAGVDALAATKALPFPKLIHVKDFKPDPQGPYSSPSRGNSEGIKYAGCRLGEGVVPIKETLSALLSESTGVDVAIDLEMECGADGVEATRHGVQWLRQVLSEIA